MAAAVTAGGGPQRIRLDHVIVELELGGGEMMLYKLLSSLDSGRFHSRVIALTEVGPIGEQIRSLGIEVEPLHLSRRQSALSPGGALRLMRALRTRRADIVQTWMYHADLVGGIAARLLRRKVIWNVQAGTLDRSAFSKRTLRVARLCGTLSRVVPAAIVSCSEAAIAAHGDLGYATGKFVVIPNGADLQSFRPDAAARSQVRAELGITDGNPIVGMAARFHPQKDHRTFLEAAALLVRRRSDVRFVLCGREVDSNNDLLVSWIRELGLEDHVRLLGPRRDMQRVIAALDVAALSSAFGEGFPNFLGEAMAAGVPCVATDVGDSALIIGETGRVVPTRSPEALAGAWQEILALSPRQYSDLSDAARRRVTDKFSLPAATEEYGRLYERVAARGNARPS